MVSFPPCKINLGLNILSKRPDGYHDLETCFYPVPWTDILEIIPSNAFDFSSSGNTIPGRAEENICVKAYLLLKKDFDLPPVKIHLHKIIPTGAGLGGGSADGAFTLGLLNSLFELNLSSQELSKYAATLGSDCAFFIHNNPMIGTGRGEILNQISIDLKGKFLLLAKPNVHVSTAEAYSAIKSKMPDCSIREIVTTSRVEDWRALLKNDFEESVFKKYPAIATLKEEMYLRGAIYASMSGSGATVFGIFNKQPEPDVHFDFSGCVTWSGVLGSS